MTKYDEANAEEMAKVQAENKTGQEFAELTEINHVEKIRVDIIRLGAAAAKIGIMPGCSGNISMRAYKNLLLITASGINKGRITPAAIVPVPLHGYAISNMPAASARPSSEANMHICIYKDFLGANVIMHCHAPHLLALSLKLKENWSDFLNIDLYEAARARARLVFVPPIEPGTKELGKACAAVLKQQWGNNIPDTCALMLAKHGLCVISQEPAQCLDLAEELEHLAKIQLLAA